MNGQVEGGLRSPDGVGSLSSTTSSSAVVWFMWVIGCSVVWNGGRSCGVFWISRLPLKSLVLYFFLRTLFYGI